MTTGIEDEFTRIVCKRILSILPDKESFKPPNIPYYVEPERMATWDVSRIVFLLSILFFVCIKVNVLKFH